MHLQGMIRYGLVRFADDRYNTREAKRLRSDFSLLQQIASMEAQIPPQQETPEQPEEIPTEPTVPDMLDMPVNASPGEIIYNLEASTAPPPTTTQPVPQTSFTDKDIPEIQLAPDFTWDLAPMPAIPLQVVVGLPKNEASQQLLPGLLAGISAANAALKWLSSLAKLGVHPVSDTLANILATAKSYVGVAKEYAGALKSMGLLSDDTAALLKRVDTLIAQGDDIVSFIRGYEDDLLDAFTDVTRVNTVVKEGVDSVNAAIRAKLPVSTLTSSVDDTAEGMGKSLVYFGYENIDEIRAALAKRAAGTTTTAPVPTTTAPAPTTTAPAPPTTTATAPAPEPVTQVADDAVKDTAEAIKQQADEAAAQLQKQLDEAAALLKQQADDAAELLAKQQAEQAIQQAILEAEEAAKIAQQAAEDLAKQQADEAAEALIREAEEAAAMLKKQADDAAEEAARLLLQQQADEAAAALAKQQADDALKSNIQQVINALDSRESRLKSQMNNLLTKVDDAINSKKPIPQSVYDDVYKMSQQFGLTPEQISNLDNMTLRLNQADDIAEAATKQVVSTVDNAITGQLDNYVDDIAEAGAREAAEQLAKRATSLTVATIGKKAATQLSADALEIGFRKLSSSTSLLLTKSISQTLGTVFAESAFKRVSCTLY